MSESAANTWKWAAVDVDVADAIINVYPAEPRANPAGCLYGGRSSNACRQNARVTSPENWSMNIGPPTLIYLPVYLYLIIFLWLHIS